MGNFTAWLDGIGFDNMPLNIIFSLPERLLSVTLREGNLLGYFL